MLRSTNLEQLDKTPASNASATADFFDYISPRMPNATPKETSDIVSAAKLSPDFIDFGAVAELGEAINTNSAENLDKTPSDGWNRATEKYRSA